jgi:hypothetical protein
MLDLAAQPDQEGLWARPGPTRWTRMGQGLGRGWGVRWGGGASGCRRAAQAVWACMSQRTQGVHLMLQHSHKRYRICCIHLKRLHAMCD